MNNFLNSELRLTSAERPGEVIANEQPLFFQHWKDDCDLFIEPTVFIHECFVKTRRPKTWEAAGYDLLTWFQWCQARCIDWRNATELDREQFANDYTQAVNSYGNLYNEAGINRKLTIVAKFYKFSSSEGWYVRDISASNQSQSPNNGALEDDSFSYTRLAAFRAIEKDSHNCYPAWLFLPIRITLTIKCTGRQQFHA